MASHIPLNQFSLESWHDELVAKANYWVDKLRYSQKSLLDFKVVRLNRSIDLLPKVYSDKPEVKKIFQYRSSISKRLCKGEKLRVKDCCIEIHVLENNKIDEIFIVA